MTNDSTGGSNIVTSLRKKVRDGEHPLMSYTAVTSHQSMAQAFINELIRVGHKIMPDKELSVSDIYSICKIALEQRGPGIVMLEGRHLRGRVAEQLSRADRYKETFSVLVIQLNETEDIEDINLYDSIVDTLCERMRKTDLMFLFKARIVLILPHTNKRASTLLKKRILKLLEEAMNPAPKIEFAALTYPSSKISGTMKVLDWVEDQLRRD